MSKFLEWFKSWFGDASDYDLEDEYDFVCEDESTGLYLMQSAVANDKKRYTYKVYDINDKVIKSWTSTFDALNQPFSEFKDSYNYYIFLRQVDRVSKERLKSGASNVTKSSSPFDNDDYTYPSYSRYSYTPPKKTTGFLDKLNKSDTLVIHCADRSTDMLSQIYEGKGWDVLRDGNIDKDELHKLIESHDKIIMLGHGTPSGLINVQGSGYTIDAQDAPYLKNKKIFAIWCYADKFFENHGIGRGQFVTKNTPSEVWESRAAGCGNISKELMLENNTYWSKLCADIVDRCLAGNVQSGVDYLRKNYLEKYGNHPVTIFNADSAHVLGTDVPLPDYDFKGKKLEPKDYPYSGYVEEEFLKNPSAEVPHRLSTTYEQLW